MFSWFCFTIESAFICDTMQRKSNSVCQTAYLRYNTSLQYIVLCDVLSFERRLSQFEQALFSQLVDFCLVVVTECFIQGQRSE